MGTAREKGWLNKQISALATDEESPLESGDAQVHAGCGGGGCEARDGAVDLKVRKDWQRRYQVLANWAEAVPPPLESSGGKGREGG